MTVSQVLGGALGCLVVGAGSTNMPFRCGEVYPLDKFVGRPHSVGGIPGRAGTGTASWNFRIPPALLGRTMVFQSGYIDRGACRGVSLTKGLAVEIGG